MDAFLLVGGFSLISSVPGAFDGVTLISVVTVVLVTAVLLTVGVSTVGLLTVGLVTVGLVTVVLVVFLRVRVDAYMSRETNSSPDSRALERVTRVVIGACNFLTLEVVLWFFGALGALGALFLFLLGAILLFR